MVAMASERLHDDCNAIGVRHGHWMGCWNWPHNETLTLIFSKSSMALIPCEEKKNSLIFINLQSEGTYIFIP